MTPAVLSILFLATSLTYAAACLGYFYLIGTGNPRTAVISARVLAVSALLHVVFIIGDAGGVPHLNDVREMFTLASLSVVISFLVAQRFGRLNMLGVFVTPVSLLMFLAAGLGHSVPNVPENVRSALLPAHVIVNVLGVAAFTLAFAVATAYLIQERLLRRRQLGGLFTRLPPLDVLDSVGLKLLLVGFPLFTVGSVSGAIWAAQLPTTISPSQVLGLVAWCVFAAVLLLRVAAGWQGRRAAIGTLLGFACALAVVIGYALRSKPGAM